MAKTEKKKPISKKELMEHIKGCLKNLPVRGAVMIPLYLKDHDEADVFNAIKEHKADILKLRGVYEIEVCEGDWMDTVMIYGKPCKEFKQLQSFLLKGYGFQLGEKTVYTDSVSGKRSRYDIEYRNRLMVSPKSCTRILNDLKKHKPTTTTKGTVETCSFRDDADRYNGNGEDMENEWEGWYMYGIKVTVTSKKTGKVKFSDKYYV